MNVLQRLRRLHRERPLTVLGQATAASSRFDRLLRSRGNVSGMVFGVAFICSLIRRNSGLTRMVATGSRYRWTRLTAGLHARHRLTALARSLLLDKSAV